MTRKILMRCYLAEKADVKKNVEIEEKEETRRNRVNIKVRER